MGEIEEDNEVYEEKGDKNIKVGDLELNLWFQTKNISFQLRNDYYSTIVKLLAF